MTIYTKQINTPATIRADANGNVTTHTWIIDGVTQPETTATITRTYTTEGSHLIRHEGSNSCGPCVAPVENTLNIVTTQTAGGNSGMYMAVGAAALIVMYLSMKKKK